MKTFLKRKENAGASQSSPSRQNNLQVVYDQLLDGGLEPIFKYRAQFTTNFHSARLTGENESRRKEIFAYITYFSDVCARDVPSR